MAANLAYRGFDRRSRVDVNPHAIADGVDRTLLERFAGRNGSVSNTEGSAMQTGGKRAQPTSKPLSWRIIMRSGNVRTSYSPAECSGLP
jgi:hypothetical protein